MLGVLVQIDGYDPVATAAVTLRAASHDDAALCHLNAQTWWPALVKLPTLRYDLFDGAFGGEIAAPSSTLKLITEPWPNFARYLLADARLQLWTGEVGTAWGSWTLRFDGRVSEQPETEDGQADVSFAVDDRWLDTALLATYAGTTGAEGSADLKGQPKPLALGAPRYVAGTLIDAVNSVFQVSGYGAVQAIGTALEKLARFGAATADYASYAALVAATVPAGRWASAKAVGMARFGAPPTGQISFLVSGDAAGPDGWARKPGQLIRRLALLSGGTGKINDASLNALDTARPYNLSLYLDQQTTARQLIQQLAASVNAVAGMSWTGQLFVVPVAIGTATVTLAADGSALPPVTKVKQAAIASPFKTLAIGAERAWTVHALADIAFTATLVDTGAYASGNTYREGNIAQSGGSSWLYINPTPTSGNTPPTLPTTSDAYWRVLARAGSDGAAGAAGDPGPAGEAAPGISLAATSLTAKYDAADALVSGQSVTWTAARVNTSSPTVWAVYSASGTLLAEGLASIYTTGAPTTWTSTDNDHLTLTSAGIADVLAAYGGSISVRARVDLTAISDRKSLTKVKDGADGAGGADGADGAAGEAGADALLLDTSAASLTFQADYLGALKPHQLDQVAKFTFRRGGADVSSSATFTLETSGCTGSIDGDGLVTFSAASANGYVRVTASEGGDTLPAKQIPVTYNRDAPPPSTDVNASARVVVSVSGSSFPSAPDGTVIANAPSGTLRGQLDLSYTVDARGNVTAEAILGYRLAGTTNAWTYFSAGAVQGSQARLGGTVSEPIDDIGGLTINQTESVSANRYEVGLFVRRYSGGQTGAGSGTLQAKDG